MADGRDEATYTDHTLVTAARGGSAEAFARLYQRHAPALLRLLTRQTGDRELAADLVQETFLDAWRSMDRLATEQSFALWLSAIARNNRRAAERRARLRRFVPLEWGRAGCLRYPGCARHRLIGRRGAFGDRSPDYAASDRVAVPTSTRVASTRTHCRTPQRSSPSRRAP